MTESLGKSYGSRFRLSWFRLHLHASTNQEASQPRSVCQFSTIPNTGLHENTMRDDMTIAIPAVFDWCEARRNGSLRPTSPHLQPRGEVERPTCNGQTLTPQNSTWSLDECLAILWPLHETGCHFRGRDYSTGEGKSGYTTTSRLLHKKYFIRIKTLH